MATSRIKKGRLNHSQRIAPYLFILPAMLLTAVLMLYPIFLFLISKLPQIHAQRTGGPNGV